MRHIVLFASLVFTTSAFAAPSPYKRSLTIAAEALEDGIARARRAGFMCSQAAVEPLKAATDSIDGLRNGAQESDINGVKMNLGGLSMMVSMSGCPSVVTEDIAKATDALEDARHILYSQRPPDDRKKRRDDDDGQPPPVVSTYASMQPLKITQKSMWNQEPSVRITVPELTLSGMKGQTFYLGVRFRSYGGEWSPWVTTQKWSVPKDPFIWKNAFNHFLPYSALAEEDFADGRFVARVTVFDGNGRELTFRDSTFRADVPRLPDVVMPMPPVVMPMPVPVPPPAPVRDCGIPNDPGCLMRRNGQFPMDASTYNGFLVALRSNRDQMMRTNMFNTMVTQNYVTAAQLGVFVDLFSEEMFKESIIEAAAPHTVDPQNGQVLAAKFSSSMFSAAVSQVMASQPAGVAVQPNVVVQPGSVFCVMGNDRSCNDDPNYPVALGQCTPQGCICAQGMLRNRSTTRCLMPNQPIQEPPRPSRECAYSDDPGCGMSRNGQSAMAPPSFGEFVVSLRNTQNEITRQEMCQRAIQRQMITAKQYGSLLDLFTNELTKLEIAKFGASHVVNPQAALGFSVKFRNSLLGQEYMNVISSQ